MATELFHELYHRAFRRDCATIQTLNKLTSGIGPGPTTSRARLATQLHSASIDFMDAIDEQAQQLARTVNHRSSVYRNATTKWQCPNCRSPYCDNAVPLLRVPDGVIISVISPAGTVQSTDDEEFDEEFDDEFYED